MVKNSLVILLVLVSLAYVMSAPASEKTIVKAGTSVGNDAADVEDTKKVKRGIYGYGFGHYPFAYFPFGHFGSYGLGFGYHHFPFYGLGYQGYGHGYLW